MRATRGCCTPWLRVHSCPRISVDEIGEELDVKVEEHGVLIQPKVGVEYPDSPDDMVLRLEAIAGLAGPCRAATQSHQICPKM